MSILKFIKEVCVQTAVYWEYTGPDGMGGSEFKDPVEISCRWDEEMKVIKNNHGEELISDAQVLVTQDLVEQSYLMLGTLSDLPNDPDPFDTETAFQLNFMERYPLFKSKTQDVFIAHLQNG